MNESATAAASEEEVALLKIPQDLLHNRKYIEERGDA
jgi:hypothetical protein